MSQVSLKSEARKESGKNEVRRLRVAGKLPANLIGAGKSEMISLDAREFQKLLNSGLRSATLFTLDVDGSQHQVYVKELHRDPVTSESVHVDFYRVTPGKEVRVSVAIETVGNSIGVKGGGALEHFIRNIKVRAKPESLKDVIKVDITNLDVDGSVYLNDIGIPEDWDVRLQGNPIIMKVAPSRISKTAEDDDQDKPADGADAPAAT